MRSMKPDKDICVRKISIPTEHGSIPALLLSPLNTPVNAPGVLWLHGGGYIVGMKEMVHMSRAVELVKKHGAVVLSPGYRLALQRPFPAAMEDCYAALLYLRKNAEALGVRSDQIMVGGESAVAVEAFDRHFAYAKEHFFAPQRDERETAKRK